MWVKWLWHLLRRKEKDVYTFVFARIRVTIIDIWELKIHVKLGKFFCSKPRLFLQSKGLVFKKKDSFHHRYRSLCDWNSSCHRSPPYKYTYSHLRRQHKLHRLHHVKHGKFSTPNRGYFCKVKVWFTRKKIHFTIVIDHCVSSLRQVKWGASW